MATIGIFDSGIGGLSVFREIRRLLPTERYIYFADNAFCPYGTRSPSFIQERAREITELLVRRGAEIIVVACNTATAAAIASLRAAFSEGPSEAVREWSDGRLDHICFIGMEPAVKPAALGTKSGVVGVLATAGTLAASKYLKTRGLYEDEAHIAEHVGQGFVELVESGDLTGAHAEAVVRESLTPLLEAGADTIVLGCTHYPFLLETLRKVAREHTDTEIRFIDPAPAVARQLLNVMDREGIFHGPVGEAQLSGEADLTLLSSGPSCVLCDAARLL
ncbi:MAG: glutamate racemase [Bacteroidales bacterium]|nr:glutamate racemase [Bacteroidales bacterium]